MTQTGVNEELKPTSAASSAEEDSKDEFLLMVDRPIPGLVRRALHTFYHFLGLLFGSLMVVDRGDATWGKSGRFSKWVIKFICRMSHPFVDKKLVAQSFAVQLRKRLEVLGPTYIKLGQILSLREDLLPSSVTQELKKLLDRLPVMPFERFVSIVESELGQNVTELFQEIEEQPTGSASIAQIHRAITLEGDQVILKVVKSGIRETLELDTRLLKILGHVLQVFLARFQPKRVIDEFCEYTLRELDLAQEANNAETFAGNFRDMPDVIFPEIHREYSSSSVLCMEFLEGKKPDTAAAEALTDEEKDRLVDLGAASIIRMLYKDGFFHADLHPANLLIIDGQKCGFIDLGMVGRFENGLRRTLLYYFYCLVLGDAENAARFLTSVADPGPGGNPSGFRQAVIDVSRRWYRASNFKEFSLAKLILESISLGGQYRMYFPVEMVLMVKALVTFEGVGQILKPDVNVAELSKKHITSLFFSQFHPLKLFKESLRSAPEIVEALVKAPLLITEGLSMIENARQRPPENPFAGLRGSLLSGACLIAGAILIAAQGPWFLWAALFVLAGVFAFRNGE